MGLFRTVCSKQYSCWKLLKLKAEMEFPHSKELLLKYYNGKTAETESDESNQAECKK